MTLKNPIIYGEISTEQPRNQLKRIMAIFIVYCCDAP